MADSTLEAKVLLDVGQLKTAVASARAAFKNLEGAVGGLDSKLKKADAAMEKGASAHQVLASAGIRTEAGITAQIAALEQLKTVAGQDAVALRQISAEQSRLRAMIGPANSELEKQANAAFAAAAGSQQLGNSMTHAGAASHRANLFMINFSRGIEDLKFGLPAVINNLEGIALGYQMMAREAKAAQKSVTMVMLASLMSPAGILAMLNLVITAAYLLGPTLRKAFDKGKVGAKQLKQAVSDILDVDTSATDQLFSISSADQASAVIAKLRNETQVAANAIMDNFGAGGGFSKWLSQGWNALQAFGNAGNWASRQLVKLAGSSDDAALVAYHSALVDVEAKLLASAKMAEILGKFMASLRPSGSINDLKHQIAALEKQLGMATTPAAFARISQAIRILEDQIEDLEFEGLSGDIEVASGLIDRYEDGIKRATNSSLRWHYQNELNRQSVQNLALQVDRFSKGTLQRLDAELAVMEEQMQQAETATERLAIAQEMYAKQAGKRVEDQLRRVNEELKDFNMNAALSLGEAAVGGAFEGFFGGFKKADADQARLALIEVQKAFASLEEQYATGEISYEEFALRNKLLTREMRDAQEELALATRTNFELMVDRVGNAFEGLAMTVKKAFMSIAQDYVNLIVRRGVLNLFMAASSGGTSVWAQAFKAVLSFGPGQQRTGGWNGYPGGANPALRSQSIALRADVIPSGDIRIAANRGQSISSRLGT